MPLTLTPALERHTRVDAMLAFAMLIFDDIRYVDAAAFSRCLMMPHAFCRWLFRSLS